MAELYAAELSGLAATQGIEIGHDLERDGCPWGWAVSRFAQSVAQYMGVRDADSRQRQPSLRMLRRLLRDEQPPDRLLELVEYAEAAEDGAWALFHTVRSEA